jgi:hypothetical protein
MISRRNFFGAMMGGSAVLASTTMRAAEPTVPGWHIEWSGWREPPNQFVRFGFWMARREPMPETLPAGEWPCVYATTLGVVQGCYDLYALDTTWQDQSAPILPSEPTVKFDAAQTWARQRLIQTLASL